jgi:hypothetical protein
LVRGYLQLRGGDSFRVIALVAAVLLAWFPNRRLHAAVTVSALTALVTYIALFSLRLF